MIIGIGTDIISIERFARTCERSPSIIHKIFSEKEIAYCQAKNKQAYASMAVRFAAKEAFSKALGTGFDGSIQLNEIELLNDEKGKPALYLNGKTLTHVNSLYPQLKTHVTLSHEKLNAVAFVVLEV